MSRAKLTLIIALAITISTFAQQEGINYKALIKDASGNIITTLIEIQFNVLEASPTGTVIFSRAQTVQPDANGLIILDIASGDNPPSIGDFTTIDWASDTHYLNVQIKTGATFIDMGTTQFMAVPYAIHATTATTAITATNVTGLEAIVEGSGLGWRLKGRNPDYYGNIGDDSVDFSYNNSASTTRGATGNTSIAMGYKTTASGFASTAMGYQTTAIVGYSTAMGYKTTASGGASTAMGFRTKADSQASTAIGSYNIGGGVSNNWVATDPLFEIGNSQYGSPRSNALTILKNGTTTINGKTTVNESTASSSVHAINGIKTHTGNYDAAGVYGENTVSDYFGIGVKGVGSFQGVNGQVIGTGANSYYGVYGLSNGVNTGTNYGLYGRALNGNTNYAMYANGNMTVTGTFINPSDRKLKTNIKTMANVMPSILKLKPKTYKITTEFVKKMNMPTGLQNGFIAQELKEVFPELVSNNVHPGETKNDEPIEYLGINYNGIIPVLVKAIQEQQETIESLQSTVSSQKEDYNALLKRIVQLEKNK